MKKITKTPLEKPITHTVTEEIVCDHCNSKIEYYRGDTSVCRICSKDCCSKCINKYPRITESDRYGEFPSICCVCISPYLSTMNDYDEKIEEIDKVYIPIFERFEKEISDKIKRS